MSERPKLYPRCFMGWWVAQGRYMSSMTMYKPEWGAEEWTGGSYGISTNVHFIPSHNFGDIPYEQRCVQITEEMCEPDPLELLAALEAIADLNPASPGAVNTMQEIACGALAKHGKAGA